MTKSMNERTIIITKLKFFFPVLLHVFVKGIAKCIKLSEQRTQETQNIYELLV